MKKIDVFTKIVLAVIAINLSVITVKNIDIIPAAYASEPLNNKVLTSKMNYGLVPLNEDGSITVKLSSTDEIDVNITGIDTYDKLKVNIDDISTSDELNVNLKSVDNYSLRPIEVKVVD